jgi:hypothetical protein
MDVLTPRGQQTLKDEQSAAKIFEESTGLSYVRTPDDQPAKVDAVIVDKGRIVAVVETKCRYGVDRKTLREKWSDEWLVTMEKVESAKDAAALLAVPLYGFLFLVDEGVLLTKQLADATGQYSCKMRLDNTSTQRTVNGGSIVRCNAFIDMTAAKEWKRSEEN